MSAPWWGWTIDSWLCNAPVLWRIYGKLHKYLCPACRRCGGDGR